MSSHWPTYDEWFASLSKPEQERAHVLTERLCLLGAQEPESWARSEISENIAQLARFVVLNTIKSRALDYWQLTGVLDEAASEDPVFDRFLKHLRQAGFTDREIGRFAQKIAAITAWQVVHTLDEGCDVEADGNLPGWSLEELDSDGKRTGRDIGGLHESVYEFDPTRPKNNE